MSDYAEMKIGDLKDQIAELEAKLADWEETHRAIIDGPCREDEKHCTCVPALRREIEELRADKDRLDWLTSKVDLKGGSSPHNWIRYFWPNDDNLREAIDKARLSP